MNQETFENILSFIVTFIILFVIGTIMYFLFKLSFSFEFNWRSYLLFDSIYSIFGALYVLTNMKN